VHTLALGVGRHIGQRAQARVHPRGRRALWAAIVKTPEQEKELAVNFQI
jgi:hypothetical protein